jgi:hypothetical protein
MGEVEIPAETTEASAASDASAIVWRAESLEADPDRALAAIASSLGPGPFALVILFVSPRHDPGAVAAAVGRHFADVPVTGCTTAGEIGLSGYLDGAIVAVGLPSKWFRASVMCIPNLARFEGQLTVAEILRRRSVLADAVPTWSSEFVFMMADGLSMREEQLVAALSPALGTTPLFGGSAADGVAFRHTFVLCDGAFRENRAVVVVLRTPCRIKAFRFDHLVPTDRRMVVTSADPGRRIVHELNAEPAARAYARALGKDPDQLSPFLFSAHPVAVRIGDRHHVCSIQRVEENGDLRFFTAVEEGLVLTLAQGQDISAHLERSLDELSRDALPEAIIAAECVLRRLEIEERKVREPMSATLRRYRVVGFNSYGEQFNMLHVNQTFTGVAIYPPAGANGP